MTGWEAIDQARRALAVIEEGTVSFQDWELAVRSLRAVVEAYDSGELIDWSSNAAFDHLRDALISLDDVSTAAAKATAGHIFEAVRVLERRQRGGAT